MGTQAAASTSGDRERDRGRAPGPGGAPRRDHLEQAVLRVLWDHPGGITGAQVVAALDGREVAVTTVLTVLERLRRKGLVARSRSGRSYLHRATATREESTATAVLSALGQGEERSAALARLVAVAGPDDLEALREALLALSRSIGAVSSPVCGPGHGAAGPRDGAGPSSGAGAGTGCGGASGLCGCCTCEPGCACCVPLAVIG